MAHVAKAPLVAAVSEAGGLGIIGGAGMKPEELREEIRKVKRLTSKPFGVNLMLLMGYIEDQIKVVIEEGVPVVTTGAGSPAPFLKELKEHGVKVFPLVGSASLAVRMERMGVDGVVVEGKESGGHIGHVSTLPLLTATLQKIKKVPVIVAGGIGVPEAAQAMKVLGAAGIQMGTRFVASEEAPVSDTYREIVLKANERSTVEVGYRFRHGMRLYKNALARKLLDAEMKGDEKLFEQLARGTLRRAVEDGDPDGGMYMIGQSAGSIWDIKPVAEIIKDFAKVLK
ncbi:enoyl-[acyl-carrier-protein] reductase FabK [bacterium 3DAC]|nr:enoyl-[acyl-carrier-protein] reductase FabK [Dictyoglomota bacterium]UZN23813.1 enoyl-[acyl-carrier-protein] reductase FabK [bacterium 3DAC]